MSGIVIFKDIATEDALLKLEAYGEKYAGLYVDMNDKEQRKFAKDQAELINGLLKKIDRARIDVSKNYKLSVESEAKHIKDRLAIANKPFADLIERWNAERKIILDNEKRIEQEKEAAIKYINDFDEAITLNKVYDFELKEKQENERIELERIKEEAANKARLEVEREAQDKIDESARRELMAKLKAEKAEEDRLEAIKQAEIDKQEAIEKEQLKAKKEAEEIEAKRLAAIKEESEKLAKIKLDEEKKAADVNHQREINRSILDELLLCGASEAASKKIIQKIAKNEIEFLTINY